MKISRLPLAILLLFNSVASSLINPSPLIQETYIQFTQMVCDNNRVGYFCDATPCYYDTDCFNGKCNMYARCEPRILFDAQQRGNEIAADKDAYIKNKLDKGNSTSAKNETEPIAASKVPLDSKTIQDKHF